MKGKLWKAYLHQLLVSPRFWLSVLAVAITASVRLISMQSSLRDTVAAYDLLYFLDAFRKLIPLFVSLPFAPQFAREWNSGYFTFVVGRCHAKAYARTQAVICTISSFLVCYLGLMLFIGYCSMNLPFYIHDEGRAVQPYGYFLSHGVPLLYIMITATIFSLSCAMWSMCGLVISAIFPNVYVALCAPFICSYLVEHLTDLWPPYINFFKMSLGLGVLEVLNASPLVTYLYNIGFFLLWIVLLGRLYRFLIEKRVRNEFH
jgi:hypothetical protein